MQIKVADKGQCGEANDFLFCDRFFLSFFLYSFNRGNTEGTNSSKICV